MDRMNKIYETFFNYCSEENRNIINNFLTDSSKLKGLNNETEEYKAIEKEISDKYQGSKYKHSIQDENLIITFSEYGLSFRVQKEVTKERDADIRFYYSPYKQFISNSLGMNMFIVGLGDKGADLDDVFNFCVNYNFDNNQSEVSKRPTFNLETIFTKNDSKNEKKYKEKENTYSMLMEDIAEYFDDPQMFTEMILLKYDVIVKDDDVLSVIHDTITSLKNKNTVQNKLKI